MLKFETTLGHFTIEMLPELAPVTVENFMKYADDGFFDGTIFHRVMPGFVIQGGGFTPDMEQKETREKIKNEADNGVLNKRGALSMARTKEVDSATSQFFVNLVDNTLLDHGDRDFGYAVFARVVEGMEVVDAIAEVETGSRGFHENVPVEPVIVNAVTRINVTAVLEVTPEAAGESKEDEAQEEPGEEATNETGTTDNGDTEAN